jgi:hypothetical protein
MRLLLGCLDFGFLLAAWLFSSFFRLGRFLFPARGWRREGARDTC